jgi:hypothetical protein
MASNKGGCNQHSKYETWLETEEKGKGLGRKSLWRLYPRQRDTSGYIEKKRGEKRVIG